MEVREFLQNAGIDLLRERGVLHTVRQLLQGRSVHPLIQLMKDQNVERLTNVDGSWYLAADSEFANPNSRERRKSGHIDQLDHLGNVFVLQNTSINPHYDPGPHG